MNRIGITQLARMANVSLATADRALNRRAGISEKTRQRVLRIAEEMGYKPNLAARALSIGKRCFRIGICIPQELHVFFDQIRAGMQSEARQSEDYGLRLIQSTPTHVGEEEERHIRELMDQDINALIVCPGATEVVTPLIDEAERKGIRVICVPSDVPGSKRSSVVGINPDVSGKLAGELMSRFLVEGGEVVAITGSLLGDVHRRKTAAFKQEFERLNPGRTAIEVVEGDDDEALMIEKTWDLLEQHKSLKGIYVTNANCLPVCYGLTARKLAGKMTLITTDLFPEMVPYFERRIISASIYQQPFEIGQHAMRIAISAVMHSSPMQSSYSLAPQIVMAANMHLFREISQANRGA